MGVKFDSPYKAAGLRRCDLFKTRKKQINDIKGFSVAYKKRKIDKNYKPEKICLRPIKASEAFRNW